MIRKYFTVLFVLSLFTYQSLEATCGSCPGDKKEAKERSSKKSLKMARSMEKHWHHVVCVILIQMINLVVWQ